MLKQLIGAGKKLRRGNFQRWPTTEVYRHDNTCSSGACKCFQFSFATGNEIARPAGNSLGTSLTPSQHDNTNEAQLLVHFRKKAKKAEMLAAFTCNKCGGRTGISFSKVAYERGVVIARCSKCDVQHLISDQLGWFGEKSNIEDILREKGQDFRKSQANGVLALSPEDVDAWSQCETRPAN